MKFKKIGIIAKSHADNAPKVLKGLIEEFTGRGCTITLDTETAEVLGDPSKGLPRDKISEFIDLLIVLGGDGTLLSAARFVQHKRIPILGVNLGSLGFLTEITVGELQKAIECLETGSFIISSRLTLKTTLIRDNEEAGNYTVLNDAVINKAALARMISLQVTVNRMSVATFKADGIIISTPTGSTAYSMAAGGPIVYPTMNAIIVAPICPHMLSNRPLVISDNDVIDIKLLTENEEVVLTLDGQVGIPIKFNDVIRIEKSDTRVDLIELPGSNFFNILRRKLNWGPTNHNS